MKFPKPTRVKTARGKKAKGSRLEREFAKMIRHKGLDDTASRMVLSGAAWNLKTDINTTLPYAFECKNQEKMKFWEWWEQAKEAEQPFVPAVLVHSANYRPIMVSMEAETFLNLLKELEDLRVKNNKT